MAEYTVSECIYTGVLAHLLICNIGIPSVLSSIDEVRMEVCFFRSSYSLDCLLDFLTEAGVFLG